MTPFCISFMERRPPYNAAHYGSVLVFVLEYTVLVPSLASRDGVRAENRLSATGCSMPKFSSEVMANKTSKQAEFSKFMRKSCYHLGYPRVVSIWVIWVASGRPKSTACDITRFAVRHIGVCGLYDVACLQNDIVFTVCRFWSVLSGSPARYGSLSKKWRIGLTSNSAPPQAYELVPMLFFKWSEHWATSSS